MKAQRFWESDHGVSAAFAAKSIQHQGTAKAKLNVEGIDVRKFKNIRGFTILELMITLGIVAILVAVGVPGFRSVIMDNRMVSQANLLVTSVNVARSNAVKYQRNAAVCSSTNHDAAVPTCSGATDWSTGWIVWVDKDRDGATDANEIISVNGPLNDASTLTSTAAVGFAYDSRGFGILGGDDLMLCDDRTGETGRRIRINAAGRTNVSRQGCS